MQDTQQLAPPPVSPHEMQKQMLKHLMDLALDCARTEAEIENKHELSLAKAEKSFGNTQMELEHKGKQLRDQHEQQHAERKAAIIKQFTDEARKQQAGFDATRRKIEVDHATVEREVKQRFQNATWLAESVLDGTVAQLSKQKIEVQKMLEVRQGEIDQVWSSTAQTIAQYGRTPPSLAAMDDKAEPTGDRSFDVIRASIESQFSRLRGLFLPRFFTGPLPFLIMIVICALVGAVAYQVSAKPNPSPLAIGISVGVAFIVMIAAGVWLKIQANRQIDGAMLPLIDEINQLRLSAMAEHRRAVKSLDEQRQAAEQTRQQEVEKAKAELSPLIQQSQRRKDNALVNAQAEQGKLVARLEQAREQALSEEEINYRRSTTELEHRIEREDKNSHERREQRKIDAEKAYVDDWAALRAKLDDGLKASAAIAQNGVNGSGAPLEFIESAWKDWKPPKGFVSQVRFGQMLVDLGKFTEQHADTGNDADPNAIAVPAAPRRPLKLELPPGFAIPATLSFPSLGSMLIQSELAGRAEGVKLLQLIMTRLLTSLPPGRARFTIIDPIGLGQNFAGFMRLADYDENLVGARIWTEGEHIDQRLANLTEHMETVIQKYLRNEFRTIDEYNQQAGELAEPYRFLVIADFPQGFQVESIRRLSSIVSSGPRCGVYALILRDKRNPLPQGAHLEDIATHCLNLNHDGQKFIWKDPVFEKLPLKIDEPPSEQFLISILDRVGEGAKAANRVEVSFDTIAPKTEEFWTMDCTEELRVPLGRMGATRLQYLRLGKGVAQHTLIAGKTGSGKSTLLNAMVTNMSMWYSPEQVEFYLIDFKKGVEFKAYATSNLPHARAIAVESDREFGLSVLQRLDAELTRRGDMFRKAGVQDLPSFRRLNNGVRMPRTLLIIDEFQEFFSEDDKLAQDAAVLLDRLVRQGRAFGIHVLLGSQTIGGASGLARSTLGQMAVRIALQCSEADSQMILGDNNSAARLLSRPGEAIYNDAGGLVEGNSPFQIAWLGDERREQYLNDVGRRGQGGAEPIVFEGNAPADILKNRKLIGLLKDHEQGKGFSNPQIPLAWLGDPVSIKDPTAVQFRRQAGANALIIGQHDEGALALMESIIESLGIQLSPDRASFVLLDGTPVDSSFAGALPKVVGALPHKTEIAEFRSIDTTINNVWEEMDRRRTSEEGNPPAIFLLIHGIQRFRALRKTEESFSFGSDEGEKKPQPDKQLVELLRDGPTFGIHVIGWVDTAANIERTFDRSLMREFDHRVLFQMSASDSSLLVDSPAANKLGFHRALYYSEEQGVLEKFRPYALAGKAWLERVHGAVKA